MKTNLFIICCWFSVVACNNDDLKLYEEKRLIARLVLEDGFTGISGAVGSEGIVYLSADEPYNSIDDKYLYTAKADKEGIVTLTNQPRDQDNVWLTARYTGSNGILYQRESRLMALPPINSKGEIEIKLNPVYPKGLVKVTWLAQNNAPVVGAEIFLFVNEDQSNTIDKEVPEGFIQKGVTNVNGVVLFYGLDIATYYISGRTRSGGSIALVNPKLVEIKASDIDDVSKIEKAVALSYPSVPLTPSINVIVKKGSNNPEPLARFHVYLFTSDAQARTIYDDKVSGYILKDSTDVNGTISLKKLKQQAYYVGVRGTLGGDTRMADYKQVILKQDNAVDLNFSF